MLADEYNMIPETLIGSLGDCHLYNNHIEAAKEQITRVPMILPEVYIMDGMCSNFLGDFRLENYYSHPSIKVQLNN